MYLMVERYYDFFQVDCLPGVQDLVGLVFGRRMYQYWSFEVLRSVV